MSHRPMPCPQCSSRSLELRMHNFPTEIKCLDCGYRVASFRHGFPYITRVWNERRGGGS